MRNNLVPFHPGMVLFMRKAKLKHWEVQGMIGKENSIFSSMIRRSCILKIADGTATNWEN